MPTPLTAAQRNRSRRLVGLATGAVTAITIAAVGAGAAVAERISQTHQVEKAATKAAAFAAEGQAQTAVIGAPAIRTPTPTVVRQRVQRTVVTAAVAASSASGVAALGGQPVRAGTSTAGGLASVAVAGPGTSSRPAAGAAAPAARPVAAPAARRAPAPIKSTGS